MIGHLEGVLREKTPTRILLAVGGVGYELHIPLSTFTALPDEGKTVALHVHTHVREDALLLYGFHSARERAVFEVLIGASRVGPRLAQTILSGIDVQALVESIRSGDVAALRSVPGVGPKMAERIVVELRDRLDTVATSDAKSHARVEGGTLRAGAGAHEQTLSALINLGYPQAQARRVVDAAAREIEDVESVDQLIRAALGRLSG